MTSSSRIRNVAGSLALAGAALLALPAGSAVAKHASKRPSPSFPVVKRVSPLKLGVGDLIRIQGSGFVVGRHKNTIVFKRDGERAIFVKGEISTRTVIKLHVPLKLQAYLKLSNAAPVPTRFRIRIIAKRFGRSFTSTKLSPLVGPTSTGAAPPPSAPPPSAYAQCLAAAAANPGGDQDKDSLSNGREASIGTDPCRADTDTDGLSDGWEYQSAIDLNTRALPYPGKKPWPNPLDPSDGGNDFDGDGLSASQEFTLWTYLGAHFNADGTLPVYSDGTQNTGGPMPVTTPAMAVLDLSGDGNLTDDERDADGDGLSNMTEMNFRGTQRWWKDGPYKDEKPYTARVFNDLSATDPDTDGDGLPDGQDDQDNDGWTNIQEMQMSRDGLGLRVQPYNPCLPNPHARTCSRYIPLDPAQAWPPFNSTPAGLVEPADAKIPFVWPLDSPSALANPPGSGWDGLGGPQGS